MVSFLLLSDKHQSSKQNMTKDVSGLRCKTRPSASTLINIIDWLMDWLSDWLMNWMMDGLIDWLIDWLIEPDLRMV